jgi:hypothetical protein
LVRAKLFIGSAGNRFFTFKAFSFFHVTIFYKKAPLLSMILTGRGVFSLDGHLSLR